MLNWIFKPRKKFSLENLKYLHQQLLKNLVVTKKNQNVIVEVLRQMAELMIWGDKHNPSFFDFFCEKNILKNCIEILGQKCEKSVKVQIIQSLSILLQNTHSETAVFYLLSNNYINDLIVHKFDFSDEGLLAYYISFLKTLSLKLNPQTIQFFFNEKAQDFPLYTEAIKFFNHNEQMVRIAVRTLTLNVYKVDYEPCQSFILNRSAVPYFSNLVHYIVDQAKHIQKLMETSTYLNSRKVNESVANQIDLYYYIQDIFDLGKDFKKDALGNTLMDQLLAHFVLPVLIGSLLPPEARQNNTRKMLLSPKLALFLLSQVFLVFRHEAFVNAIATCLVDKHPPLLSKWLMHAVPNHPIKSPVPLTDLLYNNPRSSKRESLEDTLGTADHDEKTQPSTTSDGLESPDRKGPDTEGIGEQKKRRRDLPRDMNLNARSFMPDVGPVVSPVKACPNYYEPLPSNDARTALMSLMRHKDESLLYGVVTVLVALLKNPAINKEVLVSGGICPQQYYHKRRLLQELISDEGPPGPRGLLSTPDGYEELGGSPDGEGVEKKPLGMEDFKVLNKDAINLLLQRRTVDTGSDPDTPRAPESAPPEPPPTLLLDEAGTGTQHSDNKQQPSDIKDLQTQDNEAAALAPPGHASSGHGKDGDAGDAGHGKDSVTTGSAGEPEAMALEEDEPSPNVNAEEGPEGAEPETSASRGDIDATPVRQESARNEELEEETREPAETLEAPGEPKDKEGDTKGDDKLHMGETHDGMHDVDGADSKHNVETAAPTSDVGPRKDLKEKQTATTVGGNDAKGVELEYCKDIVETLLGALATQPPYRLVTVQMVIDLLGEMVLDHTPNPCLNDKDIPKLERAYHLAARDVAKRFSKTEDHDAMLNNFQTCFKEMSKPIDIEELLTNAVTLLPQAKNAISGVPLEYRRPSGKMEAAKKSIQVYLLLRGLRFKLLKINDFDFPLSKAYADEMHIKKQQQIQISDQDAILCIIMIGKRREKHFLVVYQTLLLLVQHHPTRAGFAIVKVVVPLRVQVIKCMCSLKTLNSLSASWQEVKQNNSSATSPNLVVVIRQGVDDFILSVPD
uniref:FPL domain-containing protein n=1 Tax=Lotharella globosa TaxID=91324 RepID=A0A7S3YCX4_9EUKA